jgi:non-ribosomal peptide synthetase component F
LFVNTLLLRTDLSGDPSFLQLLERVRNTALDAFQHQDLPFDKLIEHLNPERSSSRCPVTDVMFVMQEAFEPELKMRGLSVKPEAIEAGTASYDLVLKASQEGEQIELRLDYNAELYRKESMERMLGNYERLLGSLLEAPLSPLSSFQVFPQAG